MEKNMKTKHIALFLFSALLGQCALADTVAVVSAKSPIASATNEEVANLFLGKSNAIAGASATPVGLKEGSAVRDAFFQKFAGKSADQAKAIISKQVFTGKAQPMKEVASDADIKAALGADSNAVGMIDSVSVDASVKVIAK